MKNKICIVLITLISMFLISNIFSVNAYESSPITFSGQDSSKSIEEKNNFIRITNNNEEYETTITFLVHGLTSDASVWSNTLGESFGTNVINPSDVFGYNPNSIIEVLRRRSNADVYLVNGCNTTTILDAAGVATSAIPNSFRLRKLFVKTDSLGQQVYAENNYVSSITSLNNHMVVVYEASSAVNNQKMDIAYKELEYVINMITYDVTKTNNSKVKINLIGHSRGGLINMKYAINYPYNVDSMFSIGTPYNGASITPLNGLINKLVSPSGPSVNALGLDNLINCPGGQEISAITKTNNSLKDEWINMNETYSPNINFHPIAGETGMTYLIELLDDASSVYSADADLIKIVSTIKNILIIFERTFVEGYEEAHMPEYLDVEGERLYNYILPVLLALYLNSSGISFTNDEKTAIISLLSELYYSYEADELILKTDLFVDYYSQLAEGFDVDSYKNEIPVYSHKKIFTSSNSVYENKAVDAVGIVHNNESRDMELINYILMNINLSGNDSLVNTCYLSNGRLAVLSMITNANDTSITIPSTINVNLHSDSTTSMNIEGISSSFTTSDDPNNIRDIYLGVNVKEITQGAFNNFDKIEAFHVNSSNSYFSVDTRNNLYDYNKSRLIKYCNGRITDSSFTLPILTTSIDEYAFTNNEYLTSINLNNVTVVGERCFYNAVNLSSISGTNLKLAYNFAFHKTKWYDNISQTKKLGKVLIKYIDNNKQSLLIDDCMCIYSYAFINNTGLSKIICNDQITLIDKYAFINNESLTEVFLLSDRANIINSFSFVGNNEAFVCHFTHADLMGTFDYGVYRNCWSNVNVIPTFDIDCSTENTEILKTLSKGKSLYYEFNVDCGKSYKFVTSADAPIEMKLYDSNMNFLTSETTLSADGCQGTITRYLGKGRYYLQVNFVDNDESGEILTEYQATWPVDTYQVYMGDNNILTHLHKNREGEFETSLCFYNSMSEGFYKFTLIGYNSDGTTFIFPESAIAIYRNNNKSMLIEKYPMINNDEAINYSNSNQVLAYLYGDVFIDVSLPINDFTSLILNVSVIEESTVDLFDLSETSDEQIIDFDAVSRGDNFTKIILKQAGLFQLDTSGLNNGKFVILKGYTVFDEGTHYNEIYNEDMISGYTKQFSLLEGTYYIGYINCAVFNNTMFKITRLITEYGSNNLLSDPYNAANYGTEYTLNKGILNSNQITQGFTRFIYLSTGESRLNYYWYSSDESIARITDYGTVIALNVTQDTTVKIMAVSISDPSITYIKEFIVKKDLKTYTSDPLEYNLTLSVSAGSSDGQIDLSSLNVPINWLQYYNWSSSNSLLYVDNFGRIYAYPNASGNTYTITGTYKLNSRVKIYITVEVI